MAIRAKTRRRLMLLIAVVVAIGVLLTLFVTVRRAGIARELEQRRSAGIEAAQDGRYLEALPLMERVIRDRPAQTETDAPLLYWFAQARRAVPAADGGPEHLRRAAFALKRVTEIDPHNRQAARELLELYVDLRQGSETLALAEQLLRDEPEDAHLMHSRALALVWLGQLPQAAAALEQLIETHPEHAMSPFLLAQVYGRMQRTPQQIVAWAGELEGRHPEDPRFDLLLGYAYRLAQDMPAARAAMQRIIDWTPTDPEIVSLLTRQLVAAGYLDESLQVLRRADAAARSVTIRRQLAQRLWELGLHEQVLELLADLNPESPSTPPPLVAHKAMAHYALEQTAEGDALVGALESRQSNPQARSWNLALRAGVISDPAQTNQAIELARQATGLDSDNIFAWWVLGQAYAQLGERDLAVENLRRAALAAPLWPLPHIHMARLLTESGRVTEAVQTAQWARTLAPRSIHAAVALVNAWAAAIDAGVNDQVDELLRVTTELLRVADVVPGDVLRVHATLLLRLDRPDEAAATIESALASDAPLSDTTWLALAAISRRGELGLEAACLARAEQVGGRSAELVLRQARAIGHEQGHEAAMRLLDDALAQAPQQDRLLWQVARARYLADVDRAAAVEAWQGIARDHADNLRATQLLLDAEPAWANRVLIDRAIDRLRAQTGDSSRAWRLYRARWLIGGPGGDNDFVQALTLLDNVISASPDLVEPRLLAAICHERLGNFSRAVEQLSTAVNLRPTLMAPRLDYARLLLDQGQTVVAISQLDQVLAQTDLDPVLRRQAAALVARAGRLQRAIAILEQMAEHDPADQQTLLLLANLYRRADEPQRTAALCAQLLEEPSGPAIEFAADFYASRGQLDQAYAALDKLESLDLPAATTQLIRANFAVRHQSLAQALEQLQQATRIAPDSTHAWHGLLALAAKAGRGDVAVAAVTDGLRAIPDDEWLNRMRPHIDLIERYAPDEAVRPVVVALVEEPGRTAEAIEVLNTIRRSEDHATPSDQLLTQLRSLANRYPRFLAVQTLVVRKLLAENRSAEAAALAQRAMQAFPSSVEPAWMAAEALAAAGQWSEAMGVAQEWRRRSSHRPLAADLMIAEAEIQLHAADRAAERMQQYIDRALANPQAYAPVLIRQARALLAVGAETQAAELLAPLLHVDGQWREIWMRLAVLAIENHAVAADWLEQAAAVIPADDAHGQAVLARAWYTLGQRSDHPAYLDKGRDMLVRQAGSPDATMAQLFNLALIYEVEGKLDQAAQWYHKTLALQPDATPAMNNLAMVRIKQGHDLHEAIELARKAIELHGRDFPPYLDTLAMAYSAVGDHEQAVEVMRRAVALDPRTPDWRARLAKELAAAGHREEAGQIAMQILDTDPDLLTVSEELRETVRALGSSMSAAVEPLL
jgi:tetratricopeptide (TPR) repeat protein